VFHGDFSGKVNQAQVELMAAQSVLKDADLGAASDNLFWADPWSADGQRLSAKILPVAHDMRLHSEKAIVLINQARDAGQMREPEALDAMDMGARKMDFIGYKFEAAQEIVDEYKRAYQQLNEPVAKRSINYELGTINGVNGQCQDIREGYGLMRDLYSRAWLKENRSYWLDNVQAHYDLEMQRWIQRAARFTDVSAQYHQTHQLPKPEDAGIPQQTVEAPSVQADVTGAKKDK
jgi:hypothetical protein